MKAMFKKCRFSFIWQPIRRFEHGKEYFAKRKDKFYPITSVRSLVKAVEHRMCTVEFKSKSQ